MRAERGKFAMGSWKALFVAGGVALATTSYAEAADLLPPAPAVEPAPPVAAEFSGWYLRGDVGMAVQTTTATITETPNPLNGAPAGSFNRFYNSSISASGLFDAGVGYQVNNWLRFDVTGEYRGGSEFQSLEQVAVPPKTQFADFYRGNLSSYIFMANGYVDVGTWYGVTPFVGAGVGWAQNRLTGLTDTGFAYSAANPGGSPTGGFFGNGTTNNFAWALMTGLDFDVTQNLKLELGYRYLSYGTVKSGTSNCFNGTGAGGGFSAGNCGGSGHYLETDRLASSDFRLGLRWLISDVPNYAPAPIVTKY
jgi:opacity protein-like surface antigen